jgi:hypothetical protein
MTSHIMEYMGVTPNFNNLVQDNKDTANPETIDPGKMEKGQATMRTSVMVNGMQMNALNEYGNNPDNLRQGTVVNYNLFSDIEKTHQDKEALSYIALNAQKNAGGDQENKERNEFESSRSSNSEEDLEAILGEFKQGQDDIMETGIIIDKEQIEVIEVKKVDKKVEDKERQMKIDFKDLEMREYMKKMIKLPEDEKKKKDKIKVHMIDIRDHIEYLNQEKMNDQKFWGLLSLNEDDAFDYGRDILKEGTYETEMVLPYTQFPLFTKTDWFKDSIHKPIVQVAGILRSGNLSCATLKAKLIMEKVKEEDEAQGILSDDENKSLLGENPQEMEKEKEQPKKKTAASAENMAEKIELMCKETFDKYPFDLTNREMLEKLSTDVQSFKVRVYLISAQNLTAVGTQLDLKSRLAGMTALCTAHPYPAFKVGDTPANPEARQVKEVKDREDAIYFNLNPKFFRI